jgi:hypothetical protein
MLLKWFGVEELDNRGENVGGETLKATSDYSVKFWGTAN